MQQKNKMTENITSLKTFASDSGLDDQNKHLWVKGASLFVDQLNSLIEKGGFTFRDLDIISFDNVDSEALGLVLSNQGSDKSTVHNYHLLYSHILRDLGKEKPLNILEIGLGTNDPNLVSTMGVNGTVGASVRSFKEFLPNANIYGCDIDVKTLFREDRIDTCYVDQLNSDSFGNIRHSFGEIKYDLIIDDGLHSIGANFNTLLFALDNVKEGGWIVIEDIHKRNNWHAIIYILSNRRDYKTWYISSKSAYIFCAKRLH